ncbi:hypothetical protein LX69_01853 [Breznakibacter xylanolyticus]|uniref:Secreted protein n=1 Tax=Breznakibacter xylanolyticus TaxID=990 RepID=A0A2W7Q3X8_9BACT|nr:hypothetical protein [Breznakibacter xylanolyticus]PZX16359.1 hypothetical protein LX69_01853 [Breznakibacter xylanolyticus]
MLMLFRFLCVGWFLLMTSAGADVHQREIMATSETQSIETPSGWLALSGEPGTSVRLVVPSASVVPLFWVFCAMLQYDGWRIGVTFKDAMFPRLSWVLMQAHFRLLFPFHSFW